LVRSSGAGWDEIALRGGTSPDQGDADGYSWPLAGHEKAALFAQKTVRQGGIVNDVISLADLMVSDLGAL